jgi:hypothetical protein
MGSGPQAEWAAQSIIHVAACGLMNSSNSTPDQMLSILRGADLRDAFIYLGNKTVFFK